MKKSVRILIIVISSLIVAIGLILGIAFSVLAIKSNNIDDDFSLIYTNEKYSSAVKVDGVEIITQEVSCGYAVIEMFSAWNGGNITESGLYHQHGKVVTSTGKSFCNEWNQQFPEYDTKIYKWLKNTELIDKVTVANPYGYIETLSIKELLDRTSFKAFERMPLIYRLAFAFGIFEKNTVFIPIKCE